MRPYIIRPPTSFLTDFLPVSSLFIATFTGNISVS